MHSPRTALNGFIAVYCAVAVTCVVILANTAHHAGKVADSGRGEPGTSASPTGAGVVRRLTDQVALYPRVIRLTHSGSLNGRLIATVVSHHEKIGTGEVYESTDDGVHFTHIGTIADPRASNGRGLCCATLFEVPAAAGQTSAGTLLWAASVGQDTRNRRMALRVWQSIDHGHKWSYLSSCATALNTGGLWEPELSVDSDNRLICHFSDETQPGHSQALTRVASSDGGRTWSRRTNTVVGRSRFDRPGMPVVRSLPYGIYVMTYEMCIGRRTRRCTVHLRSSLDGWNWNGKDVVPRTGEGSYFEHAPTIAWSPGPTMFGRLILVGQILTSPGLSVAPTSGHVLLVNDQRGAGPWEEISSPVVMPVTAHDSCSNYSSALLPSTDGKQLLEIATRTDPDGVCRAYFTTRQMTY